VVTTRPQPGRPPRRDCAAFGGTTTSPVPGWVLKGMACAANVVDGDLTENRRSGWNQLIGRIGGEARGRAAAPYPRLRTRLTSPKPAAVSRGQRTWSTCSIPLATRPWSTASKRSWNGTEGSQPPSYFPRPADSALRRPSARTAPTTAGHCLQRPCHSLIVFSMGPVPSAPGAWLWIISVCASRL
jgi:hypothetical protein